MTAARLPEELAQARAGPCATEVDVRWLMAYAAAAGATGAAFLDTRRPDGPVAHPLFPVCYEWPALLALRAAAVPEDLGPRGVHLSHDLVVHRLPRAGDRLLTTAIVVSVAPRPAGTLVVVRLETIDADGAPVTTTEHGTLFRGIEATPAGPPPSWPGPAGPPDAGRAADQAWEAPLTIPPGLAHVYTECAGIWNPIHTDPAVAEAAGLPGPILHGTATLALALSHLLARVGADAAGRVRRVSVGFGAPVLVPSSLTLSATSRLTPDGGRLVAFDARSEDAGLALRGGQVVLGPG